MLKCCSSVPNITKKKPSPPIISGIKPKGKPIIEASPRFINENVNPIAIHKLIFNLESPLGYSVVQVDLELF